MVRDGFAHGKWSMIDLHIRDGPDGIALSRYGLLSACMILFLLRNVAWAGTSCIGFSVNMREVV
jgi:hypothetical protein